VLISTALIRAASSRARRPARAAAGSGAVALLATVAAVLTLAGCSTGPAALPGGPAAAHTVTAPLAGRQRGELAVMSGATSVTVTTAALGGDLLRVSTPAGAGIKPDLVVSGGTVQLYLANTGINGPAAVRVTLNSGVGWRLAFSGGST
jgi:hypothetical protein